MNSVPAFFAPHAGAPAPPPAVPDVRLSLHAGQLGLLELASLGREKRALSGYSPDYQIVLPFAGLFAWRTRSSRTNLLDANKILLVAGEQEFDEDHPVPGVGHASLILTPRRDLLDELCGRGGAERHPAFDDTERPATLRSRLLAHWLLRRGDEPGDALAREEVLLAAIGESLSAPSPAGQPPSRVVGLAKQYLHAHGFERVTLDEMARQIGVTPVYLTQAFSRAEGVPLYRYQLRLRLSRALLDLPRCEDLTALALELGFSSHSHFTAAFRQAFGMTPSDYRSGKRLL